MKNKSEQVWRSRDELQTLLLFNCLLDWVLYCSLDIFFTHIPLSALIISLIMYFPWLPIMVVVVHDHFILVVPTDWGTAESFRPSTSLTNMPTFKITNHSGDPWIPLVLFLVPSFNSPEFLEIFTIHWEFLRFLKWIFFFSSAVDLGRGLQIREHLIGLFNTQYWNLNLY